MPCKICLNDNSEDMNNPLINPCHCNGSMKFIHLNCLRKWIHQRIRTKDDNTIIRINWEDLACELCQTPYPFAVYFNGKIHELIMMDSPIPPYMVLYNITGNNESSNEILVMRFFPKATILFVIQYKKLGK